MIPSVSSVEGGAGRAAIALQPFPIEEVAPMSITPQGTSRAPVSRSTRTATKGGKSNNPEYRSTNLLVKRAVYADAYAKLAKEGMNEDMSDLVNRLLEQYTKNAAKEGL